MPALDDLMRKIRPFLPTMLGGYPEGYAESRLGHQPMQVIPDAQWGQTLANYNIPPAYGFTAKVGFSGGDKIFVPQREYTGPFTGDLPAPSGSPPGTIPRHEAIHAFLGPVESKLDTSKIADLIGQAGLQHLYGKGYNYSDAMREVPARLTTDPASLGMTVDTGRDAMRKYIELLRQQDPSRATRLSKYLGLSGSEKGDGVAELQRPNDTF